MPYQKPPIGAKLNYGHPLAKGLVGCWLFNEGSGDKAFDYSGNGNHGTITNVAAQTTTSGWNASAHGVGLRCDGDNDYILGSNLTPYFAKQEASLVAGLKLDLHSPANAQTGLWSFNTSGGNNHYPFNVDGNIYNGTFNSTRYNVGAGLVANRTQMHQVAVTAKTGANGWNFYQEGRLVYSNTQTWQLGTSFKIGESTDSLYNFAGIISFLFIYNRALSTSEIVHLNAFPFCMFDNQYPAYWLAEEGEPPAPSTFTPKIIMIM